jgi:hypothetical protein
MIGPLSQRRSTFRESRESLFDGRIVEVIEDLITRQKLSH